MGEALGARESQLTDMRIQMRDPEALLQALIGFSRAQLEDALYKLATKDLDLETIKDVVAPLTEHLPPPKLLSPRGHRRSISASGPHGCCALSPRSKMGQFTQHILSLDSQLSATRDELAATTRYWHEAVEHNYKLQVVMSGQRTGQGGGACDAAKGQFLEVPHAAGVSTECGHCGFSDTSRPLPSRNLLIFAALC